MLVRLITVWLEVRILAGPPRTLSNLKISQRLAKRPQLAGFDVGVSGLRGDFFPSGGDLGLSVSARGNPVSRKPRPSSAGEAARISHMSFANDDPEGQAREHHALLPLPKNGSSLDCGDRKHI